MKLCKKCSTEKPLSEFATCGKKGLRGCCKNCWATYMRGYCSRNREKVRELDKKYKRENPEAFKNSQLKSNFGISLDDYNQMLEAQNGVCAICKRAETAKTNNGGIKRLAVDHCHKTGKVRDLLCAHCNKALGALNESEDIILNMLEYIRKHNKILKTESSE